MQAEISSNLQGVELTRFVGGFITVSSVGMGLVFMFAVPVSCSFVGSVGVILSALLFLVGLIIFLVGQVGHWRKNRRWKV